ncbi:hypothetical protein ACFQ0T_38000 [Kitasatospora gansuensis]
MLADRVLDGANPADDGDEPRFGLGGGLRHLTGTVAAVMDGIDPAGEGDVDFEQRYGLTSMVRHCVMEPAGRELLSRAERSALIAIDDALVLATGDEPAAAVPSTAGDGPSDSVSGMSSTPARRPLGAGPPPNSTRPHPRPSGRRRVGRRRRPCPDRPVRDHRGSASHQRQPSNSPSGVRIRHASTSRW